MYVRTKSLPDKTKIHGYISNKHLNRVEAFVYLCADRLCADSDNCKSIILEV